MTDTEIAWAAGFFDGEGSVTLSPHGKKDRCLIERDLYRHLTIRVAQKRRDPIDRFKTMFGGYTYNEGRGSHCFYWVSTTRKAARALSLMLPFLVVKRTAAEFGIRFQATMRVGQRWKALTDTELEERRVCWAGIKSENSLHPGRPRP